jgi:hypothetical protein
MIRSIALASVLAVGVAASAPAAAGNVGWNVTVGGPGFAVSAGQPGFGGGFIATQPVVGPAVGWGPAFRPVHRHWGPRFVQPAVVVPVAPGWGPGFVSGGWVPAPAPVFAPIVTGGFATVGPGWRRTVVVAPVAVRRPVVVAPVLPPPAWAWR